MRRWLFNLTAALSLFLFVATIGCWVRGYLVTDFLHRDEQIRGRYQRLALISSRGFVAFWIAKKDYGQEHASASEDIAAQTEWEASGGTSESYVRHRKFGFGYQHDSDVTGVEVMIQSPWWPFTIILSLLPIIWLRSRWRRSRAEHRRIRGQCSACGYSLTGNTSGVCPECGTPVPKEPADKSPRNA